MILDLSNEDLGILDEALKVLPYYRVAPLINKINTQIRVSELAPSPSSADPVSVELVQEVPKEAPAEPEHKQVAKPSKSKG